MAGFAVFLMCACSTDNAQSTPPTSVPTVRYTSDQITFTHPTAWAAANFTVSTSQSHGLVALSNQTMSTSCLTTLRCHGWALHQLNAMGTVVGWLGVGMAGWTISDAPGRSITVGGLPARELISNPGVCKAIGADETIELQVASKTLSNFYAMEACLRGPNLAQHVAEVDAMVSSTTFPNG